MGCQSIIIQNSIRGGHHEPRSCTSCAVSVDHHSKLYSKERCSELRRRAFSRVSQSSSKTPFEANESGRSRMQQSSVSRSSSKTLFEADHRVPRRRNPTCVSVNHHPKLYSKIQRRNQDHRRSRVSVDHHQKLYSKAEALDRPRMRVTRVSVDHHQKPHRSIRRGHAGCESERVSRSSSKTLFEVHGSFTMEPQSGCQSIIIQNSIRSGLAATRRTASSCVSRSSSKTLFEWPTSKCSKSF